MYLRDVPKDEVYRVVTSSECGVFVKGDKIWVDSSFPTSVNFVGETGWIEFGDLRGSLLYTEIEKATDWCVEKGISGGSRLCRVS